MKPSILVSFLSFALVFSVFSHSTTLPTATTNHSHHAVTLNQTGGDPEPIDPPSGGGGGN